jgi:hypothetical protein
MAAYGPSRAGLVGPDICALSAPVIWSISRTILPFAIRPVSAPARIRERGQKAAKHQTPDLNLKTSNLNLRTLRRYKKKITPDAPSCLRCRYATAAAAIGADEDEDEVRVEA